MGTKKRNRKTNKLNRNKNSAEGQQDPRQNISHSTSVTSFVSGIPLSSQDMAFYNGSQVPVAASSMSSYLESQPEPPTKGTATEYRPRRRRHWMLQPLQWWPCRAYRWTRDFIAVFFRLLTTEHWLDQVYTLAFLVICLFACWTAMEGVLHIFKTVSAEDADCSIVYVTIPGPIVTISLVGQTPSDPNHGTYFYSVVNGTTQWLDSIAPPTRFSTRATNTLGTPSGLTGHSSPATLSSTITLVSPPVQSATPGIPLPDRPPMSTGITPAPQPIPAASSATVPTPDLSSINQISPILSPPLSLQPGPAPSPATPGGVITTFVSGSTVISTIMSTIPLGISSVAPPSSASTTVPFGATVSSFTAPGTSVGQPPTSKAPPVVVTSTMRDTGGTSAVVITLSNAPNVPHSSSGTPAPSSTASSGSINGPIVPSTAGFPTPPASSNSPGLTPSLPPTSAILQSSSMAVISSGSLAIGQSTTKATPSTATVSATQSIPSMGQSTATPVGSSGSPSSKTESGVSNSIASLPSDTSLVSTTNPDTSGAPSSPTPATGPVTTLFTVSLQRPSSPPATITSSLGLSISDVSLGSSLSPSSGPPLGSSSGLSSGFSSGSSLGLSSMSSPSLVSSVAPGLPAGPSASQRTRSATSTNTLPNSSQLSLSGSSMGVPTTTVQVTRTSTMAGTTSALTSPVPSLNSLSSSTLTFSSTPLISAPPSTISRSPVVATSSEEPASSGFSTMSTVSVGSSAPIVSSTIVTTTITSPIVVPPPMFSNTTSSANLTFKSTTSGSLFSTSITGLGSTSASSIASSGSVSPGTSSSGPNGTTAAMVTKLIAYADNTWSFVFPKPDITTSVSYWTGHHPSLTGPDWTDLPLSTRTLRQTPLSQLPPLVEVPMASEPPKVDDLPSISNLPLVERLRPRSIDRRPTTFQTIVVTTVMVGDASAPVATQTETRLEARAAQAAQPPTVADLPSSESCGESGIFTLSFDDSNVPSGDTDVLPVGGMKNPYHHLFYANGFAYMPDKWEPYAARSQPNVAVFLPIGNSLLPNSPFAGTLLPGQLGAGPRASVDAYWFHARSGYFGCALNGITPCTLRITGYRYDSTLQSEVVVAEQSVTIAPCWAYMNCQLTRVDFDEGFRGLSGIQFNAFTYNLGIPQMFMMDDLEMEWYNNTCSAGILRIGHNWGPGV